LARIVGQERHGEMITVVYSLTIIVHSMHSFMNLITRFVYSMTRFVYSMTRFVYSMTRFVYSMNRFVYYLTTFVYLMNIFGGSKVGRGICEFNGTRMTRMKPTKNEWEFLQQYAQYVHGVTWRTTFWDL
jgi:hypothetical protein